MYKVKKVAISKAGKALRNNHLHTANINRRWNGTTTLENSLLGSYEIEQQLP